METANSSEDVINVAVYMNRRPEDVMKIHSIPDEDVLVGGELTREALNILFLNVELNFFYEFMVSAFRKTQPHALELPLFVDAEVKLNSRSMGVGTVRDVIKSTKGFQS